MDTKLKYQTVANVEEQHLAALSTKVTTKSKKSSKKTSSKSTLAAETTDKKPVSKDNVTMSDKMKVVTLQTSNISAEQSITQKIVTKKKKKQVSDSASAAPAEIYQQIETTTKVASTTITQKIDTGTMEQLTTETEPSISPEVNGKKKSKSKKGKKSETDHQNISVKASFSKFDAMQKRNLIHNPPSEKETNCRLCSKPVFKMEEVKAEKSIFHKNCFRCQECNKALKVGNYQSHEGGFYCNLHFKLLFAPKCVEDNEPEQPRKPELIIRENQPIELPPDVVKSSDKPDLGLDELSQLNVRSRFQVFENPKRVDVESPKTPNTVIRSTSMLSKLAKLQSLGICVETDIELDESSTSEGEDDGDEDRTDLDLVRSKKCTQRERPVGLGEAMNDIKTKFEKGHMLSKEERREERKQEIQSIRSRLFLGKQARIKEMYQQAVADSEQTVTSAGKQPDIELECTARSLKERFENGEMFRDESVHNEDKNVRGCVQNDADVFESAISKKSRSIFMELDANVAEGKTQTMLNLVRNQSRTFSKHPIENEQEYLEQELQQNTAANIVKCDEKPEDVKIETSEIISKFKFFETYRPKTCEKKEFRITPPREGDVKISPNDPEDLHPTVRQTQMDQNQIEKSHTTSMMLNKFREMEQNKNKRVSDAPRPLKCFTPPPDGGKRLYQDQESDLDSQEEDDDSNDEEGEEEEDVEAEVYNRFKFYNDEALKEAQAAARAKQLRAKFEKWEANQLERELNDGQINIYSQQVSDDSTIESAKTIRERFESMKNSQRTPTRTRYQVNRFV